MISASLAARRSAHKGFGSAFAMAIALACGTVVGGFALETPAYAAKKPKTNFSKAFVEVYSPASEIVNNNESAAVEPVRAMIPGIIAAMETDDDKEAGGTLILIAGNKLNDPVLQRQGLELRLASNKLAPEQIAQFNYFVGSLAYNAKDYEASRAALQAAQAAGSTEASIPGLVAETYFQQGRKQEGLSYLASTAQSMLDAGQTPPEEWYRRGLAIAYEANLKKEAGDFSALMMNSYPSEKNWLLTLQVIRALNEFSVEDRLDILRLMLATNATDTENDYFQYMNAVDERVLANEELKAINHGIAAGILDASDVGIVEAVSFAKARAPGNLTEANSLSAEAKSDASGKLALGLGDTYMSFDKFAEAEAMYVSALSKGDVSADLLNTRIGMAQIGAGNISGAIETLGKVGGSRALIGQLWLAYAKSKLPPVVADAVPAE